MSGFVEFLLNVHNYLNSVSKHKQLISATKSSSSSSSSSSQPLRIGVLGAAAINYTAIFDPIESHPDVVIVAIGARDVKRAQEQIRKYRLGEEVKAYGSYEEVLGDERVDAVYIPLPNGLHAQWAIKSLQAGKHVLIEKPIAANHVETQQIQAVAAQTGKIALEAYHWRFHPANHVLKTIIDSKEFGDIKEIDVFMQVPDGVIPDDDIRFNFDLGGGSVADLGYVYSVICYLGLPLQTAVSSPSTSTSTNTTSDSSHTTSLDQCKIEILSATSRAAKLDPRVDAAMNADFLLTVPPTTPFSISKSLQIKAHARSDLALPKLFGFIPRYWAFGGGVTITLDRAVITLDNFVGPWLSHSIAIQRKVPKTEKNAGPKEVRKCYKGGPIWSNAIDNENGKEKEVGEEWWTTYRYQLEAFVRMVRDVDGKGKEQAEKEYKGPWMTMEESVKIMEVIDDVVEKAGLPKRGRWD